MTLTVLFIFVAANVLRSTQTYRSTDVFLTPEHHFSIACRRTTLLARSILICIISCGIISLAVEPYLPPLPV